MALCVFEHEICIDRVPAKRFLETFGSITTAVFFKKRAAIPAVQSTEGDRDRLEIGALAAGTLALYYFVKKKESAAVQTLVPNEDTMKKEPTVSEEDQTIPEETFGESDAAEVTETNTQEPQKNETALETESEPAGASAAETKETASAFKPAPGNRRIGQYDDEMHLIAEYDSATVAAKAVGSNRTSIRNCANGKQKHAGGFIWRYLDQQPDREK